MTIRSLLAPRCPTKLLSGLDCPACGGVRLAQDLLRADFRAALHDNPYLLLVSPLLLFVIAQRADASPAALIRRRRTERTILISALAWMALRNIPGWPLKPRATG